MVLADRLGNIAFGVQTELLKILPQKVLKAFITHSKLVLKSQLLIIEKRQKANIFSHFSRSELRVQHLSSLCV